MEMTAYLAVVYRICLDRNVLQSYSLSRWDISGNGQAMALESAWLSKYVGAAESAAFGLGMMANSISPNLILPPRWLSLSLEVTMYRSPPKSLGSFTTVEKEALYPLLGGHYLPRSISGLARAALCTSRGSNSAVGRSRSRKDSSSCVLWQQGWCHNDPDWLPPKFLLGYCHHVSRHCHIVFLSSERLKEENKD